ncbi:MAG: hypothetical protein L6Q68_19940, partial [Aquabacterium sp.]|nr:hypothetical protein [Aquabacterium sp.]
AAADTLRAGAGDDVLLGAAGNDSLDGGTGDNTFVFGRGHGQDVIASVSDARADKLNALELLPGIAAADVKVARSGHDIVLSLVGTADSVRIQEFFSANGPGTTYNPVQEVRLADGTLWTAADLHRLAFTAGPGNDTFTGFSGARNTYTWGRGDGQDTIASHYDATPGKLNTVQFKPGIVPADVTASRVGSDLVLAITGTTDTVRVKDFFYSDMPGT